MYQIIKAITFATLILLIAGCKKEEELKSCASDCITFTGSVYDPNNEEYLSSNIYIIHHSFNMPTPAPDTLAELMTDADGNYSYSLNTEQFKFGSFEVKAGKSGYTSNTPDGHRIYDTYDAINSDISLSAELFLRPKAELEFWLKVPHSLDHGDLEIILYHSKVSHNFKLTPMALLDQRRFVYEVGADEEIVIYYTYKNGEIEESDTFFIAAGEYRLIEITE